MDYIKVLSSGINHSSLPEKYVRPESERPNLSQVSECQNVPLIDLAHPDRSFIIRQIQRACQSFGFFQVVNHGVRKEAVEEMIRMAEEFFNLPVEEKMKLYSDDPAKTMRLSTSFNVKKEQVHNWRDYLRLHCWPLPQYVPEWPSVPPSFKEVVSKYCIEVRSLGMRLEEAISESLGLEKHYITQVLGEQGQHMAINFYPPCPEPELTYGLPAHTDPNALTILLQDSKVSGLQVLIDGTWLSVKPHPDAFVVNIGDQLQGRGRIIDTISEIQERHDAVKDLEQWRPQDLPEGGAESGSGRAGRGNCGRRRLKLDAAPVILLGIGVGGGGICPTCPPPGAATDLERNLRELHQVVMDMAVLVEHQGEQLNDIEAQVLRANSYVRGGTTQLQTARKHQKNTRKWTCYAIILLLIIILIVILSLKPWNWK